MATSESGIDYKAVLKDLEARKAQIEAMIANVRQMLGMGAVGGSAANVDQGEEPVDLRNHPFLGMSIGDAAKKYLQMKKHKQTVKEIADALERGGLHHVSANFPATVATMISRYAKADDELLSTGRGEWALAAWYGNRRPKPQEPPKKKKKAKSAPKVAARPSTATQPQASPGAPVTAREMAVVVLREMKRPLHVDKIIGEIKLRFGKDIPRGTIVTMIADSVRRNKTFQRVAPNTFTLIKD